MDELSFSDNAAQHRFELRDANGSLAGHADYKRDGDALVFTHTEVAPQFEGRGVGGQLARQALDATRERGLKAVPKCEFIAAYIARHAQYQNLVAS